MDYIDMKVDKLKSMLENTKNQTKYIEEDKESELENLISKRDDIIQAIDKLDNSIKSEKITIPSSKQEEIKELLKEIIAIDNVNKMLMNDEIEHIKSELKKIRIGKQQGENYGNEYGVYKEEGIFFDTKE